MLLPVYEIWTAMKYHFRADNHTFTRVVVAVNGFSAANLTDITTCVASTSYSFYQDGPGAFYSYTAGIASNPCCMIA